MNAQEWLVRLSAIAAPILVACGSQDVAGRDGSEGIEVAMTDSCAGLVDSSLAINGGFEPGPSSDEAPAGWATYAWLTTAAFGWDETVAFAGERSVSIIAPEPNDARWTQVVALEPHTPYRLSGWLRTEAVAGAGGMASAGANLCLDGTWEHSPGLVGTNDWTFRSLVFDSGERTQATLCARLGYWGDATSGAAWFDDVRLEKLVPREPHPPWRLLVLIYPETDFSYVDNSGTEHHLVATMSAADQQAAIEQAQGFAGTDLPLLSGGNARMDAVVRISPAPLTQLTSCGEGWSPSPVDVAADLDPAFDTVIAYWDPRATDLTTMTEKWMGCAGGLTWGTGTAQGYTSVVIDAASSWWATSRNPLKHEFGHQILSFGDALGVAPEPTVDNHALATSYVHCPSGASYVWVEETLEEPVPNSIYNNESGFTHDYYSGQTATPDQPTRCLGITPDAWAWGGPATVGGVSESWPVADRIDLLFRSVHAIVESGAMIGGQASSLEGKLSQAKRALERGRMDQAAAAVRKFLDAVDRLEESGRIPMTAAQGLVVDGRGILRALCRCTDVPRHKGRQWLGIGGTTEEKRAARGPRDIGECPRERQGSREAAHAHEHAYEHEGSGR